MAIFQGTRRHLVDEVILHCSATRPLWWHNRSLEDKIAEIRQWHVRDNGWKDIGYHFIIDRDGKIGRGRAETVIGAHVVGRNSGTIGICLMGGHGSSSRDAFETNFTKEQRWATRWLVQSIASRTPIKRVTGHNQYAAKACPGFTVRTEDWVK
jgi:N-acetyl-anhydromuramyl-L-alanine amidase AmpD